jgi:hypothetical protein
MTVTLTLPPDVERAFLAEAEARGLSLDEFIGAVLASRIAEQQGYIRSANTVSRPFPLEQEDGVPVLRTGQPIAPSVVDDTLDLIRRERERTMLGSF